MAADEFGRGLVEQLTLSVPLGQVQATDSSHRCPRVPHSEEDLKHGLPIGFGLEDGPSDQHVGQEFVYDGCDNGQVSSRRGVLAGKVANSLSSIFKAQPYD